MKLKVNTTRCGNIKTIEINGDIITIEEYITNVWITNENQETWAFHKENDIKLELIFESKE